LYSIVATASSFFLIGNIRGKVVHKSIIASGFNTVLIGGAAAAVSYCIGYVLSTIIYKSDMQKSLILKHKLYAPSIRI
jgi:VIT1/CCC1 family predicted Fe2+/Mn2+ transporter